MQSEPVSPQRVAGSGFIFWPGNSQTNHGIPSIQLGRLTPEALGIIRDERVGNVHIAQFWHDDGTGLEFLKEFADHITGLSISAESIRDLSVVHHLPNLSKLSVSCSVEGVDFARLPQLRSCSLEHPASLGNVGECPALDDLALVKMRTRDLTALRGLTVLRQLYLSECMSLASLAGIEGLPLEKVQLLYLSRLLSIAPLAGAKHLREFEVLSCKKVTDVARLGACSALRDLRIFGPLLPSLDFVGGLSELEWFALARNAIGTGDASVAPLTRLMQLRHLSLWDVKNVVDIERLAEIASLEHLVIGNGPVIPTLAFLRPLKNLRSVVILKTRIVDRDLSTLLDLPCLERVSKLTPARPTFSPSLQELNALLQARRGAAQA